MKDSIRRIWTKIPVLVRAILIGLTLQIVGVMPLSMLLSINIESFPGFPWAVLLGSLYLWLFWRFATGTGRPFRESASRKNRSRLNPMDGKVRTWSFLSGCSLIVCLTGFTFLGYMLTEVPSEQAQLFIALSDVPYITSIPILIFVAVFSGIIEELSFRGYMQGILEARYSAPVAIVIVALAFAIIHFLPLPILPLFVLGSLGWGTLVYLSNSVVSAILYHALMDLVVLHWALLNLETLKDILKYDVFRDGMGLQFEIALAVSIVFGVLTIVAFRKLAASRKVEPAVASG